MRRRFNRETSPPTVHILARAHCDARHAWEVDQVALARLLPETWPCMGTVKTSFDHDRTKNNVFTHFTQKFETGLKLQVPNLCF